jgi:hypothetical protein
VGRCEAACAVDVEEDTVALGTLRGLGRDAYDYTQALIAVGRAQGHHSARRTAANRSLRDAYFDVAVIGQGIPGKEKQRILTLIREYCPPGKVLELFSPLTGKSLSQADASLEVPATFAADLPEMVSSLERKQRP